MAKRDKPPPTYGAFEQHILRVHVQAKAWSQASIANQVFVDPMLNGYHLNTRNQLKPTKTDIPSATEAVVEIARCHCKGDCSSQKC